MEINEQILYLKELAEIVKEISNEDIMVVNKKRWINHNKLKSDKPFILCFPENAWNELLPFSSMKCDDLVFRTWEYKLRQNIYWWQNIRDDNVVTNNFDIPYKISMSDYGFEIDYHKTEANGSYKVETAIKSLDEIIDKIKYRKFGVDKTETIHQYEMAKEIFDDVLNVRIKGPNCFSFGLSSEAIKLIGLENFMLFMYDEPESLHKLMEFLMNDQMNFMDFMEREELLFPNNENDYIPSGGIGYSDEFELKNDKKYTFKDMWGFSESQETVSVSPEMFNEFVFTYQKPLIDRIGILSYGCCEPLENRWNYIKELKNLRRISVSPWSNQEKMSEYLKNDYIYARKPNPSIVSSIFDEEAIKQDLAYTLKVAEHCNLEIILKDTHTVHNEPARITNWVKIARNMIDSIY